MSFFSTFFDLPSGNIGEAAVHCPFPHHTASGHVYKEQHPSAHVNIQKGLFNCKACGAGYSETAFISQFLGTSYSNAVRLQKAFNNSEDVGVWDYSMVLEQHTKDTLGKLGIIDTVIEELKIRSAEQEKEAIVFPVFMFNHLVDIRVYTPGGSPKVRSRLGATAGLIMPFDIWRETPKTKITLICAGEKDMATTRSHGFNAICMTGGENTLPANTEDFKGRDVVILYDNDDAGKSGAIRLAASLLPICNSVKVCTKFHEVCTQPGEDMTDFWNKYNGTREQLINFMNNTPLFTEQDAVDIKTKVATMTLAEATRPEHINKVIKSNIQVVAVSDIQFITPVEAIATKFKNADSANQTMHEGTTIDWELKETNLQEMLSLMDGGFSEEDTRKNLKLFMKIPPTEKNIRVETLRKEVVYKGHVTDMFESMSTDNLPMEYTAYSLGTRLESGKKYTCTYKLVPHPHKGQAITMLILNAVPANDSVSKFKIDDTTRKSLALFRRPDMPVEEQVHDCVQRVKGLLGYDGNDTLIKIMDLAYHTPLAFNFGRFTNVRAYLDTIIVGESRVGKSSTADALRKTYQLGMFTSLAGNSATIPGLVGGSNKTSNGAMQTKAGLIPQNHKGLIIFEEFGKCNSSIVTELTDIRSSNEVRITRVSGTLTLPAMVRMISLSNVKSFNGEIKSIASYPGGIQIITELVPTAEDIARYDLLCVLGDKGTKQIDPFWTPADPYPEKAYQDRIRWVWSRTPDEIFISETVAKYIIDAANNLNKDFDCHIKIFGTEAWKKVARLAIAIAGYCVSTEDTYQYIIVKQEHVDYAVKTFLELYDNPVFRLREYVQEERKYSNIDENGMEVLKNMYAKVPQLLITLEREARPSKTTLMASTGLAQDEYNGCMSMLIRSSFVKLQGSDVLPTERFRKGMSRLNKDAINLRGIGEEDEKELPFN